jgi:hypothetical protein
MSQVDPKDTLHFHRGGSTLEMLDEIPGERLYLVHLADVPAGPREETLGKGCAGCFVVEILSQPLWREDPLDVARRCQAGGVEVLDSA